MPGETNLRAMLASLRIGRRDEPVTVVHLPEPVSLDAGVLAVVEEDEGTTAVVTVEEAVRRGWPVHFRAAWLTVAVHSSLEAVGLTAALADVLASRGIACNVLAGYFHDHLLVPIDRAGEAIECLESLAGRQPQGSRGDAAVLPADLLEDVRVAVYSSLARTGALPTDAELAAIAGSAARADAAIRALADQRAWALGRDGDIVLAHPFATRSFGYSVMSETTLWWGGCAWDSFAIPHLVPDCGPVVVASTCPACDRVLSWRVDASAPPAGSERAHFLVPTAHMWDDVVHTCSNQLLFCDDGCIDDWLAQTGNAEGYRMDLETLWRFAAGWYAGRLDRGYRRREPAEARDYFASVGLEGPFWGLA